MHTSNQLIERQAFRQLRNKVRRVIQPGNLRHIVEQEINSVIMQALNAQLEAERDEAIGRAPYCRSGRGPARNGYKSLHIPGLFSGLTLKRPVVRKGSIRLPLIDAMKNAGKHLCNILAVRFWLRGAATRSVAEELREATGARMSASTVSTLTNALEPTLRAWETRPIPQGLHYVMLDALYLPVRRPGFTKKQALLVALGVDPDGRRHVLGFLLGDRESKDSWEALINDLLARGLDRKVLHMVISDEHKGIESAVASCLGVAHQLCVIHKIRNLRARVPRRDWKTFLEDLHPVYWAVSREAANRALGALEARWGQAYPKAVSLVGHRFEDHTRFFDEPEKFWTLLRSTNLIERFNLELRRRFNPAGTMHSELEVSKIVWSVSQAQESRWAKRRWKSQPKIQPKEVVAV